MNPSQQAQVNFIMDCLRKGEQRKTILGKFGAKWGKTSKNTFDRRLKKAGDAVAKEQERIRTEAEGNVAEAVKGLESKIMTAIERKEYLTRIVDCDTDIVMIGKLPMQVVVHPPTEKFPKGRKELVTTSDKLKAVAELNKMEGSYEPEKHLVGELKMPTWIQKK